MVASSKKQKTVSFDTVEVREYPCVPSLNPAGHYGVAFEIGWEYRLATEVSNLKNASQKVSISVQDGRVPINDYERVRPSKLRRDQRQLELFANQSEYYVKKNNFTDDEIQEAAKQKATLYKQRERSTQTRSPGTVCKTTAAGSLMREKYESILFTPRVRDMQTRKRELTRMK